MKVDYAYVPGGYTMPASSPRLDAIEERLAALEAKTGRINDPRTLPATFINNDPIARAISNAISAALTPRVASIIVLPHGTVYTTEEIDGDRS